MARRQLEAKAKTSRSLECFEDLPAFSCDPALISLGLPGLINLDTLLSDVPDTDCRIVLAHNPDTADTEFNSRIDLMLAGHTHGGQFVLPFLGPPYNPVVNKEYTSGLRRSGKGEKVFISKGVGWGTFPARLNCFPEIAVLELLPRDQAQAGSTD